MADFSVLSQEFNRVVISSVSRDSVGEVIKSGQATTAAPSAQAWPTANKAFYIPFVVYQPFVAAKMFLEIGGASGNIDAGIYDDQKNQLVAIGGVAQAGTNAIQEFDITDTILSPGVYYMGVAADNTTGTVKAANLTGPLWCGAAGILMQTSAYPLPSPAVWVATVNAYMPILTVTGRATV